MSVRLKKAAKKLRKLFGVELGVQPAKAGEKCTVLVLDSPPEERWEPCSERAHVREDKDLLCKFHMKESHRVRSR